jgi:glutamyl-tRNA synthetase
MNRGRLAPTPSGYLHLGHARTFAAVVERCREVNGKLIFRMEDLDTARCRPEFGEASLEDLRWLGLDWDEGPDRPGELGPYRQSERSPVYERALDALRISARIYPCRRSRRDLNQAGLARVQGEVLIGPEERAEGAGERVFPADPAVNWRFVVPEMTVAWEDDSSGPQDFRGQRDFGDFLVWRRDGFAAYELAVVVDDIAMGITQVVRGADLRRSTARQHLLYEALAPAHPLPSFEHLPLVTDLEGRRLSKTAGSLAIRELRARGFTPEEVLRGDPAAIQRAVGSIRQTQS